MPAKRMKPKRVTKPAPAKPVVKIADTTKKVLKSVRGRKRK